MLRVGGSTANITTVTPFFDAAIANRTFAAVEFEPTGFAE
jgi:hypothetical protein